MGLVFWVLEDQLFSPTVFDDIGFGPLHMGLAEEVVREQVGMTGFETQLSHHLNVGQKKRVAIATVLAMAPEIQVLDEPTAGLDPRGRRALIRLLADLPVSMLVSTHDMQLVAKLFPRLVVLDEGRMVGNGNTTTVLLADTPFLEAHGLEAPCTPTSERAPATHRGSAAAKIVYDRTRLTLCHTHSVYDHTRKRSYNLLPGRVRACILARIAYTKRVRSYTLHLEDLP